MSFLKKKQNWNQPRLFGWCGDTCSSWQGRILLLVLITYSVVLQHIFPQQITKMYTTELQGTTVSWVLLPSHQTVTCSECAEHCHRFCEFWCLKFCLWFLDSQNSAIPTLAIAKQNINWISKPPGMMTKPEESNACSWRGDTYQINFIVDFTIFDFWENAWEWMH